MLTFCLRPQGTTDTDATQCSVGRPRYTTSIPGTDDELFSNDFLLGLPNPLIFTGDVWPVSQRHSYTHSNIGGCG